MSTLTDYHVHLRPDDISATPDEYFTAANIERYLAAAGEAGVTELGCAEHMYRFTAALEVWDHEFWKEWSLNDLDQYCETVGASDMKLGIEADFVAGREEQLERMLSSRPFDFVVGSVHFIGDESMDTEEYSVWNDRSDPDAIWRRYFETLAEAASCGLFDILAHPDLVKVWGRASQLPSRELEFYYEPAIEAIAASGIAVEISTAGLRKGVGEIYPAPRFLEMCLDAGATFALSSDAHSPEQIAFRYDTALELMEGYGIQEIAVFEDRQRRTEPLAQAVGRPAGGGD